MACDFAGILCPLIAVDAVLGINYELVYISEKDPWAVKLVTHKNFTLSDDFGFDADVQTRQSALLPKCDLFVSSPPCQPWSKAGSGEKEKAPESSVCHKSLEYIYEHAPTIVIFEEVPEFKGSPYFNDIVTVLERLGYTVDHAVLDASDYNMVQKRKRLFIVGINDPVAPFRFPLPVETPPIESCISILPDDQFRVLPSTTQLHIDNVKKVLENAKPSDIQAGLTLDAGVSHRFSHGVVGVGTLTKAGCSRRTYWNTKKGGFLSCDDMAALQGIPRGYFDINAANIAEWRFGGMIGNGIAVTAFAALLVPCLLSAGFCTEFEATRLVHKWQA